MSKTAPKIEFEGLRSKLKLKKLEAQNLFVEKYPQAFDVSNLRRRSSQLLGAGILTGTLFLAIPNVDLKSLPPPNQEVKNVEISSLTKSLSGILPDRVRPLTHDEEKKVEQILQNNLNIKAKATLEGENLNTTYGIIGAEQHLARFPGDSTNYHGQGIILREGMAPGLGAWGYFASSKEKLTQDLEEKEKWYAVVQTLYLESWNRRFPYLRDWYKYRKVLIVNTKNGNAVVADVADSGPAAWTGKHFGGSPEVMQCLGGERYKKGSVLVFFVDDPENKIPLGPVYYNYKEI